MQSVEDLLVDLDEAEITLTYKQIEGKLNARPSAALTPEMIEGITKHKPALVEILRRQLVGARESVDRMPLAFDAEPGEVVTLAELRERRAGGNIPTPLDTVDIVDTREHRNLARASELGLVAMWSKEFGYVSLHDPTTGEWHDLRTEDAPGWAKREAFKRKELYRDGNRKASRLTSREMEEIWEAERVPEPEGIIEDHPIEEEE